MGTSPLPQRSRVDATYPFMSTSQSPNNASSYYSDYLGPIESVGMSSNQMTDPNMGTNDMTSYNNVTNFQAAAPQYRQYTPQPESYLQQQETLDPRANHLINNSLSPSTVNDRFSPDPAMLSDGISAYSTPGFDDSFLEGQFAPIMNMQGQNQASTSQFGPFPGNEPLGNYSNQLPASSAFPLASNLTTSSLPSPQSTHRSSPVVTQNFGYPQPTAPSFQTSNHERLFVTPGLQHLSGVSGQQQPSPALTSSSAAISASDVSSQPQLVVTIDNCADDNQGLSNLSRSASRRSHGNKRAKTHLSPYPESESSDDEMETEGREESNEISAVVQQRATTHQQADESWPSRAGVEPDLRMAMNADEVPTLEEMEEQRLINERNAGVAEWLAHSEAGSETGRAATGKPRKKKSKGRPRAKSTNDAAYGNNNAGLGVTNPVFDDSLIPGPGLYLRESSEMGEGYESSSSEETESPVAPLSTFRDQESYFPTLDEGPSSHRQAADSVETLPANPDGSVEIQGITSNLAIMRFRQRARETDNASLTATVGSRRRSESDIASVVNSAGISKLLLSPPVKEERKIVRRRGSFLETILPNRNPGNKMKRKPSQQPEAPDAAQSPKEGQGVFSAPKRIGSFGRPKSPRVDTNFSSIGAEARSPSAVAAAASGAIAHAKQIWRSRSRSDLGKAPKGPGLADLWTQSGGPPMPTLASPLNSRPPFQQLPARDADDDSGEEEGAGADGIAMDLSVRTDMHVIPTYDGFKYQARQLNPRLADFLLERVTQEQVKRYRRLIDLKVKHSQSVTNNSCASKAFCFASGGESKALPPRAGNKDPDATLVGFQILAPGMTEDDLDITNEGQTVAAQFPSGVPLPPVKSLPAEFECPLCFKVKKFYKPSDWTKHVHEDIQPFTCTFSGCNEPKSFKRKADWVRHENERHRQLESWTCNIGECTHTCYRKDNFVQHLVREHKVPEPKVRTGRTGGSRSPATPLEPLQAWQGNIGYAHSGDESVDDVWALVEHCHKDATKQPKDEPCKFCGNICSSWKKLTVHLAKHMEQISMPVLALVEQKRVATDMALLSSGQAPARPLSILPTKAFGELPTFLCDEPMEMDMETPEIAVNGVASNVMHSYPPSMAAFQSQIATPANAFTSPTESYPNSSYPPPSVRSRSGSFNDVQSMSASRQGTTFPPPGLSSRSMQYDNQPIYFPQGTNYMAADGMSNTFLTPTSGPPAGMGYSQNGNGQQYGQSYGFQN
jgi:hypothetical protein